VCARIHTLLEKKTSDLVKTGRIDRGTMLARLNTDYGLELPAFSVEKSWP
jgi:hypothetical protein